MIERASFRTVVRTAGCALAMLGAFALLTPQASAQARGGSVIRDQPTAYQPVTQTPEPEPAKSGLRRTLEAICWYLPNRIVDFTDIPRIYFTAGDGMGASIRATKYFNATWFGDDANGLGWSPRKPPFFGETLKERYFGLLAAQQGELDRDPSEVGFSFHFIMVGFNAAASLSEAADFALGFLGVDLRHDDHGPFLFDHPVKQTSPGKADEFRVYIPKDPNDSGPAATLPKEEAPAAAPAPAPAENQ